MNRWLLIGLLVLGAILAVSYCKGDETVKSDETMNGVISEERVIHLPEDQGKWFISVVGDPKDARYLEVLGWFDTNRRLKSLKDKVHFCPVTSDSPTYKERYAPNVKGLPTVRVQTNEAAVVYEVAGKNIPMSGEGLYAAIADAVNGSEALLRRRHRPEPQPQPEPQPAPNPVHPILPILDPDPQPIDDGGTPVLEPLPLWESLQELHSLLLWCAGALLLGLLIGQWEKRRVQRAGKK